MSPPCSTAESAGCSRQHEHSWHGQSELLPERSLQVVSLPRTDPFPVHIKIVIADEDDEKWDAAVFLKAKRQICTD